MRAEIIHIHIIEIKDHLSPAEAEIGAELGKINLLDWVGKIS